MPQHIILYIRIPIYIYIYVYAFLMYLSFDDSEQERTIQHTGKQ